MTRTKGTTQLTGPQLWLIFICIVVAGASVRWIALGQQSLTGDELYEIENRGTLAELIRRVDGFPPFYSSLLTAWMSAFSADVAPRWLSYICGIVTVGVTWNLGQLVGGKRAAIATGTIAAMNPLLVYFSQEGRAYSLLIMLAALGIWFGLRALESNFWRDWLLGSSCFIVGMYTHYYYFFCCMAFALILMVERPAWRIWKRASVAAAIVSLGGLPLMATLPSDLDLQSGYEGAASFHPAMIGFTFYSYLSGFCLGPSLRDLHTLPLGDAVLQATPWIIALGSAAGMLLWRAWFTLERRWRWRLSLLIAAPIGGCAMLAVLFDVGYNVRYTIAAIVPTVVCLGIGAGAWQRGMRWAIVGLLALSCVALVQRHAVHEYRNAELREVAKTLAESGRQDQDVVVLAWYQAGPIQHYLGSNWNVVPLKTHPSKPTGFEDAWHELRTREKEFWLVYSREFHADPDREFLKRLKRERPVSLERSFAGADLFRVERAAQK